MPRQKGVQTMPADRAQNAMAANAPAKVEEVVLDSCALAVGVLFLGFGCGALAEDLGKEKKDGENPNAAKYLEELRSKAQIVLQ